MAEIRQSAFGSSVDESGRYTCDHQAEVRVGGGTGRDVSRTDRPSLQKSAATGRVFKEKLVRHLVRLFRAWRG